MGEDAAVGHRLRGERGQTSAFAVVILFAMVVTVAVVADIGQAVNRKMALQLVADTGAFTGASKMAEGLNYLAYGNMWMRRVYGVWYYAWIAAYAASLAECNAPDAVTAIAEVAFQPFNITFNAYNVAYFPFPYVEARRVSKANVADLFPGELNGFQFAELPVSDMTGPDRGLLLPFVNPLRAVTLGTARPTINIPPSLADVSGVDDWTGGYLGARALPQMYCWVPTILPPFFEILQADMLPHWYQKSSTDFFVWHVKAPATKALFFDTLFGGNAIPAMRAVAVAKPTRGSIIDGDPTYVAKMVPVVKASAVPSLPALAVYDDKLTGIFRLRPIFH